MTRSASPWWLLLAALAGSAASAQTADGGALPVGWFIGGSRPADYAIETVERGSCGAAGARVSSVASKPTGNVSLMQVFRADKYRGQRLRFRATVTTSEVTGRAGLWMRVDGGETPGERVLAFDNMQTRPLRGTLPCMPQDVVLDVAPDAQFIALGLVLEGAGKAELSHLSLEPVDASVAPTNLLRASLEQGANSGRVGRELFDDSVIVTSVLRSPVRQLTPGHWRSDDGVFTAALADDTLQVRWDGSPAPLTGTLALRSDGEAHLIEGTWGDAVQLPVRIRYLADDVEVSIGTESFHRPVRAAPKGTDCRAAHAFDREGRITFCGTALDDGRPRPSVALALVLTYLNQGQFDAPRKRAQDDYRRRFGPERAPRLPGHSPDDRPELRYRDAFEAIQRTQAAP